ncbi:protein Hook homolog 2-like isoform X2 [Poecilia reticulata]|uniref:protein Hook homolog 2-like isoform X2 n=1 Tax=Poecilia reticulata TaxID=8081 RepID=UPI0004A2831A|nr:PREDICTED: protein Hook homolog 2-like isoform X2 [Poecilia reticulata]
MSSDSEACRSETLQAAASQTPDSQSETPRSRQEQEEKLILAAWRTMQQSLSEKEPAAPGLPQSFLAKQRRSTQARRARSARPEPREPQLPGW